MPHVVLARAIACRHPFRLAFHTVVLAAVLTACGGSTSTSTPATTAIAPTSSTPTSPAPTSPAPTSVDGSTPPTDATGTTLTDPGATVITFAGGSVTGPSRVTVRRGGAVSLLITSDVADEVHVHAYDIVVDVVAGMPTPVGFVASIPGVFEIELENLGRRILTLEVQP